MLRVRRIKNAEPIDSQGFRLRGLQVSRIEGISDAVFGLAITLIVVSLQVPRTYAELVVVLQGFMGSAACTMILLQIWDRHYLYFRRFGLEDGVTRILNGILLFVVVAYVYPLKFLFNAFFDSVFGLRVMGITLDFRDLPKLFVIYGVGFALVYSLFALMYWHALRQERELELTKMEAFKTRGLIVEQWLTGSTGLISVLLTMFLPPGIAGLAGFAYFCIPVFLWVHWSRHADAARTLQARLATGEGEIEGSER